MVSTNKRPAGAIRRAFYLSRPSWMYQVSRPMLPTIPPRRCLGRPAEAEPAPSFASRVLAVVVFVDGLIFAHFSLAGRRMRPVSGSGLCNFFADSQGCVSHASTSSPVVSMTGIAFGWIGLTMPFGSQVRKANSSWSPSRGLFKDPRVPVQLPHTPAKKARGRSSLIANQRLVFLGLVSSHSQKAVHGTTQRLSTPSQRRHCCRTDEEQDLQSD